MKPGGDTDSGRITATRVLSVVCATIGISPPTRCGNSTRACRRRSWWGSKPQAPKDGFRRCSRNSGSRTVWDIRRRSEKPRRASRNTIDETRRCCYSCWPRIAFRRSGCRRPSFGICGRCCCTVTNGCVCGHVCRTHGTHRAGLWRAARTHAVESRWPSDAGIVAAASARRPSSP